MKEFFIKYILSEIHSVRSLILVLACELFFFARVDGFLSKILSSEIVRFCVYGFVVLIWVIWWFLYRFRLPRNKKGKVGIIIAIHADSSYEEIRIKNDFIVNLARRISNEGFSNVINIIKIKNHQVKSLNLLSKESMLKLHKKVKGHFYLYGNIKRRKDGESTYFLCLDGMVVHRPIDIKISKAISAEFRTLLPYQISFLESLEFRGFEFTADIVYLAVRYITGIAAFISGDPMLAHDFHKNLRQEFNRFHPLPEHIKVIRDRSILLTSDEELIIAKHYYLNKNYNESRKWLSKAIETNPNNYGAWLLQAIYDFKFDRDPIKSLRSINKAAKYSKTTFEWRYSKAFLFFWLERYEKAIKVCKEISQQIYRGEENTLEEVERFVLDVLKEHPEKVQLYFWIGYLNYKKKNNLPRALEYFEKFESNANNSMDFLLKRSKSYIREIEMKMGLKNKH